MLYFIYTYRETTRGGHTRKTVRIYRVKKNLPVFVGELEETYVSEFQLVMMCLKEYRLLPPRAFEQGHCGGFKYSMSYDLEQAGIATIRRVS